MGFVIRSNEIFISYVRLDLKVKLIFGFKNAKIESVHKHGEIFQKATCFPLGVSAVKRIKL